MSVGTSANNLHEAVKKLSGAWQQARDHWRDVKATEFEERFLANLPNDAARAVAVIAEIELLLKKVRQDCE